MKQFLVEKNRISFLVYFLVFGLFSYPIYYGLEIENIGAIYKARLLCTNTFYANRNPKVVLQENLSGPEKFIFTDIDYLNKTVSAWFPGILTKHVVYMDGLGCIWSGGIELNKFIAVTQAISHKLKKHSTTNKPSKLAENFNHPAFDQQLLKSAVNQVFLEADLNSLNRTRAVLIIYKDELIAEKYAIGITKDTPLQGWSMTKSVINALVGILVKQEKLSVNQKAPISMWHKQGDPRANITLGHLLRMSSGLEFDESIATDVTDLSEMLFISPNVSSFAMDKSLVYTVGTHWQYSSGTTNIISHIVRLASGGSTANSVNLLRDELFTPLGMEKAIIELDTAGNLIGSSYMYATAREWAKFGLLYLQDGMWEGKRILPEGWVKYSYSPSPAADKGQYGAHFWINGGYNSIPKTRPFPNLPADMYYADGYKGQNVIIIPSHQIVIVRLGWSDYPTANKMSTMVSAILKSKLN